ncbi:hypothetical protein BU17DRAFT_62819 [Hysterangium stoloniferum]|nr:hypothetical protein BU17DRAFT_62819 [Hysterangium stoloniferum]
MFPLHILARTAAILCLDDPSVPAYASAFTRLSFEHLEVQQELIRLEKTERDLTRSIDIAKYEQVLAESWLSSTEQLQAETSDLERQKKAMNAKAKEYQEELASIMSNSPAAQAECPSITSLFSLQDSVQEKECKLNALKGRLQTFQGLPPHVELAKQQLRAARDNQIRLMNIRDKLLGKMNLGLN